MKYKTPGVSIEIRMLFKKSVLMYGMISKNNQKVKYINVILGVSEECMQMCAYLNMNMRII